MGHEWHAMDAAEVAEAVGSSGAGLTDEEADVRLARDGPNELVGKRGVSRMEILLKQFKDPLVFILLIAAAVSASVGIVEDSTDEMINTAVILMIVALNAVLGYTQEYKAERTLEALQELASPKVMVIRGGREKEVPSKELVVGDVMVLSTGDRVSADGRLIETANMETNEASLTGESLPVKKDHRATLDSETELGDRSNMVYSGSAVSRGRGKALVVATGSSTELGRITKLATEEGEPTPLQRKLAVLSRQLGLMVIAIAAAIMAIGLAAGVDLLTMFLTAISLAVAAIPEGLPAVVTVSLAIGLQRMARRNALIRRLPAVEALGSATVICSDKTGTLTVGVMNIREVVVAGGTVEVTGEGYQPEGALIRDGEELDARDPEIGELLRAGVLCNDASLVKEGQWKVLGDGTEGTLLVLARKAGLDPEELRERYPRTGEDPFDSERKRMTTVHVIDGEVRSYTKGAAESVLPLCTHILVDGRRTEMDDAMRESFLAKDREMASRALRVLALSYGQGKEEDLTFLGLVGMLDAPRKEAAEAVARCHTAGIRVMMITGDHQLTAEAIAEEMGIRSPGGSLSGKDLSSLSDSELSQRLKEVSVFARVAPEQKVRIVEALQSRGEIVAMTGDGVNDAPALKQANIGVAMGITGTSVSKQAADLVLTDDNFASIRAAVEEGRRVYDNLIKSLAFVLPTNLGLALILTWGVAFFPFDPRTGELLLPMLPAQLLWVNLIASFFLATPLAFEAPERDLMDRPPRRPGEPILGPFVLYRTVMVAVLMTAGALLMFLDERSDALASGLAATAAVSEAQTMAVTTVVMFQIFYLLNCRSLKHSLLTVGLWTNPVLYLGIALLVVLQALFIYFPPMNVIFDTVPLRPADLGKAALMGATILPVVAVEKAWRNWRARK